jgi:hypothetical protein
LVNRGKVRIAVVGLVVALLSACAGQVSDEHAINEPVKLEPVSADLHRVILTEQATKRLDIQTAAVEVSNGRTAIPSSAWFVQPDGRFWVYTNPESLVFVRHEISIESDDGVRTFLTAGPPPGTQVVTVGVPELLGAEFEVGH